MEKLKKDLLEIIDYPDMYVFDYVSILKNEIDLYFTIRDIENNLSEPESEIWLEMITKIESFHQDILHNFGSIANELIQLRTLSENEIYENNLKNYSKNVKNLIFMNKTILTIMLDDLCKIHSEFACKQAILLIIIKDEHYDEKEIKKIKESLSNK